MRGMNSESIDLIYLDPPFNSKQNYAAPIGSKAAGAEFKDTWTLNDVNVAWLDLIEAKHSRLRRVIGAAMTSSDKSYLIYMAVRLLEMKRLLKSSGSIYLHCDPTMSHYLKLVMDSIFGKAMFRNEITWQRHNTVSRGSRFAPKTWGATTDTILFYSNAQAELRPHRELSTTEVADHFPLIDEEGNRYYDDSSHIYCSPNMKAIPSMCYSWSPPDRPELVFTNPHPSGWRLSKPRMDMEYKKGNIRVKANDKLERRKYIEDYPGKPLGNLWTDCHALKGNERTGYPTQKPVALLERVIQASSKEGDIVFDPFCGCATSLVAADRLQREWVGIDISELAVKLVTQRIRDDQGLFQSINPRSDKPKRTDLGKIELYSSVFNKKALYGEQAGNCNGCGTHFEQQHLEVDHIIARSQGGTDHIENLQLLCGNCNRIKGDRGMEYLMSKIGIEA